MTLRPLETRRTGNNRRVDQDRIRPRSRVGTARRVAFYPARVAVRASQKPLESAANDHLLPELSRLAERALAGPLPEECASLLVEQHVLERMVGRLAANGELDALVERALASPQTQELTDRIVRSEEVRGAIREIVAGPDIRAALTQQTAGLFSDLIVEIRGRAAAADDTVERYLRRPAAGEPFAGVVTRGLALGIDALAIIAILAVLAGFTAAVLALVGGTLRPAWLAGLVLGAGWAIVAGGYLTLFWSAAGRTPGMQLLRLRVRGPDGGPPSIVRASVRTCATWLAIVPCFAGYLPVLFDRHRRGLPDFIARTEVIYDRQPVLEPRRGRFF
jgi:uncharacterized RDD family membrane protein YckC